MFEPDLNELEGRVSEVAEMLRDFGGMVQKCRALDIDAVDALMDAQDALKLELNADQECLEEAVNAQQKADMREYYAMV